MARNMGSDSAHKPQPISTVVDGLIASLGLKKNYNGWQVVVRWSEIVGETMAARTRAVRFDQGTLVVAVPDASWRQTLAMEEPAILEKIHSYPYGSAVKRLRLIRGEKGTQSDGT
jgi:hypothetical protein